jgi:hypothetical protein
MEQVRGGIDMGKEDVLKLTPGSRYRITSMMTRDEPLVTVGTFKGYTMMGNIEALVIALDDGEGDTKPKKGKGAKAKKDEALRLVPAQVIISVDVLTQVKEKKEEEPTSTSRYYM